MILDHDRCEQVFDLASNWYSRKSFRLQLLEERGGFHGGDCGIRHINKRPVTVWGGHDCDCDVNVSMREERKFIF